MSARGSQSSYQPTRKDVFERLFQDSAVRRVEKNIPVSPPRVKKSPPRVNSQKIEESLMHKYKQSQTKLSQLRAQMQAKEISQLQETPSINPASKAIAQTPRSNQENLKEVLAKSRFARKKPIKHSTISLSELEKEAGVNGEPKIQALKIPKRKNSPRAQSARNPRESIEALRKAVMERPQVLEHEEPPDLLDMEFEERNEFWLTQRQYKIDTQRKIKKASELEGCTFHPRILGKKLHNTSSASLPARVFSPSLRPNSYKQIYLSRKFNETYSVERTKPNTSRERAPQKPTKRTFKTFKSAQLSPVSPRYKFQAGVNFKEFLKKARPMVDYTKVGIQ